MVTTYTKIEKEPERNIHKQNFQQDVTENEYKYKKFREYLKLLNRKRLSLLKNLPVERI